MKQAPTHRRKIRTNDTVKVVTGADRGKQGKVQQVLTKEQRIVVEGVNLRKKHVRSRRAQQKGETIEYHAPIALSNVLLVCPKCGKPTRVGVLRTAEGKKLRQCRQCNQSIES